MFIGKTMENLRKRISVRLVKNEKDYLKHVSEPSFISQKIFDKHFAAMYKIKPVLTLNTPIYAGFTALELSKCLMYDFHTNSFFLKMKRIKNKKHKMVHMRSKKYFYHVLMKKDLF